MNERIRELAIKNAPPWMTDMDALYPDIEKFAELIVHECIGAAMIDEDGVIEFKTRLKIAERILEHFGVEE